MSQKAPENREPLHLLALQGPAYLAIVLLFVSWLAPPLAVVAAAAGVMAGLLAEARLQSLRVRWLVVVAIGLLTAIAGLLTSAGIVHLAAVGRLLGLSWTMSLYFATGFGLGACGGVVALRGLTRRWPSAAIFEAAILVALATWPLAGHRDYKFNQPRILGDWALAHGYSPTMILWGIGIAAVAFVAILRFRNQSRRQTASSIAALLLCGLMALLTLNYFADSLADGPDPDEPPVPQPGDPPPHPSPLLAIPRTPSFSEHDWVQDPKPLAIVTLHDDVEPQEFGYYFRHSAFSELRDHRFWRCPIDADVPHQFPDGPLAVADIATAFEDTLVPSTVSLMTRMPLPIGLVTATRFEPKPNADPQLFVMTYAVTSRISRYRGIRLYELKAGNPAWSEAERRHYLAGSPDPRYAELAAKITDGIERSKIKEQYRNSPLIEVRALQEWLGAHCTYSLHPARPAGADPNADFLFGERRGFCVHAAQSMALLIRSRGIPARLACGYVLPLEQRGNSSGMLLQANNAHCWCEVYLDRAGWIPVEVAMHESEEPDPPQIDPAIVQFFNERNRHNADPLAEAGVLNAAVAGAAAGLLILLVLAPLYGVKAARRYRHRWADDRQLFRLCYRSMLDRLADVGLSRQFGESREDFARRIAGLVPEFVVLSDAHLRGWLSDRPIMVRTSWLELENRCALRLAAALPRSRRILGLLNPIGWLWAR